MIYDWYYIFNTTDFDALNLVSKAYDVILEGIGAKTILVTKGNYTSITYEGVLLPINMVANNPFEFDNYAVYVNEDDNVFLGIATT